MGEPTRLEPALKYAKDYGWAAFALHTFGDRNAAAEVGTARAVLSCGVHSGTESRPQAHLGLRDGGMPMPGQLLAITSYHLWPLI